MNPLKNRKARLKMPQDERIQAFQEAVKHQEGVNGRPGESYGFSNAARYLEGCFFLGRFNLDNSVPHGTAWLGMYSLIAMSTGLEIHLAAVVRHDLAVLTDRLIQMIAHAADILQHPVLGNVRPYGDRNNNVAFYLCSDGRAYTTSKDPVKLMDDTLRGMLQPGIQIDKLYYAVHPPTLEAKTHPSFTGFIQDLRLMLGP